MLSEVRMVHGCHTKVREVLLMVKWFLDALDVPRRRTLPTGATLARCEDSRWLSCQSKSEARAEDVESGC